MLLINGRTPALRREASSVSSAAASSLVASSCWRVRAVSSVRNRMRPENLIWSGRLSFVLVIILDYLSFFSVQPLRSLCLCGCIYVIFSHHRDTENTEVAQRIPEIITSA